MTTTEDARILAHIFECAARGLDIDYKQLDPRNPAEAEAQYRSVFQKLVRDIEFIKSKARSMTWKPEMIAKVSCFSVRPESIDEWQKDGIRAHCRGCMGCNRTEDCNYKAISLFGYCEPTDESKPLFTSFDDLGGDYTTAFNAYNQVFVDGKDRRKHRQFVDGFHSQDGGMLVLGETCHNRALLYNMAHNFIFNWIFIADLWIQGMKEDGKKVKDSHLYISLEEDAENIRKSTESLKEMAAHETSHISEEQLSIDAEWWRCVRTMRNNASLLDPSKQHIAKWSDFYEKMGRRGLATWHAQSIANSKPAPAKRPPSLAEALKAHVDKASSKEAQYGSADSDGTSSSKDSVPIRAASVTPVAPPVAAHANHKRKEPEPPPVEAAASSAAPREGKRARIRRRLLHIKDKMVVAGHHADAVTILEAILELQD
tara:strand:- start:6159 stop:7442 length:1284 start_codon:yes stop_codon:yes gene_type:complete